MESWEKFKRKTKESDIIKIETIEQKHQIEVT
jgi:hypothetical protein